MSPGLPALITIGVSHYCEKARWALERYNIPFAEEPHVPGPHRLAAKAAGGCGSVPCLRLPSCPCSSSSSSTSGGSAPPRCVDESTPILRWVDAAAAAAAAASGLEPPLPLFPPGEQGEEVSRLCNKLDLELGPAARVWAYSHLLYTDSIAKAMVAPPVPAWEKAVLRFGGWLVLRSLMARGMGINKENGAAALQTISRVFDEVGTLLADGRLFLVGNSFTAADLSFAALAAPVLGQAYAAAPGISNDTPAEMGGEISRLRAHPAGRFALRLWETQRLVVHCGSGAKSDSS